MRKIVLLVLLLTGLTGSIWAQGEPSTYFNIFVPPNNDAVQRNVALVITAIFDSTSFQIIDDGMDGDTDDTVSGVLNAGQSYVLYIADNGINDDASNASGGTLKQDGDYFIITSNKNVFAMQSTNSDWQHAWAPSFNQRSIGEKFIIYSPKTTSSKRDINVFAYTDSTLVTIKKISVSPTTTTGYTNVNYDESLVVAQRLINRGQDLIYLNPEGRNIMDDGETYMIETSKPATVQYGALYVNERDGGGSVPSSNGSAAGNLFYFAVPYQAAGEQEIRIISWDANNSISLERYNNGAWVSVKTWTLNKYGFSDWVGKENSNASYPTVFRVTCSAGKRVSIYEANWLETGSPGTSDVASMMVSETGATAGRRFLAYMAPPGNEQNVRDPFTGQLFGQRLTHLYLFSRDTATVTVKDAYTNGADFSRSYTIMPERYVDCFLTETEWRNIYNGTGTTAGGPERPYLIVESNKAISVLNTNFNDNWMMYFGSSLTQALTQNIVSTSEMVIPGDTLVVTTKIQTTTSSIVSNANATVTVEGGLQPVYATFTDSLSQNTIVGMPHTNGKNTEISFESLPNLQGDNKYSIEIGLTGAPYAADGTPVADNGIGAVITTISGESGGVPMQSVATSTVQLNAADQSQLIFSEPANVLFDNLNTNSWTASVVDYNNDGWEDIYICERDENKPNYLFKNTGGGNFERITTGAIATDEGTTITSAWADIDNDGDNDALIVNNTKIANFFYTNNGSGQFSKQNNKGFNEEPGYYHNASWVDYDNDGYLDLFLCNYWPTRLNELWKNNGNGAFTRQSDDVFSTPVSNSVGATWADMDNDGYQDLFIPNNDDGKNLLFRNEGNGSFRQLNNAITAEGGKSVGSCWGDINHDGLLDLFVANASNRDNYLYINNGAGNFSKRTQGPEVQGKGHSHGCAFADIDNDADLDLYVTNDQGFKFLYANDGQGNFTELSNEVVIGNYGNSFGQSWADFDKDGDLDVFVATHSNKQNHLFINNGNDNKWINIKLTGSASNRSAIGARIRLKAGGKWQTREVTCQSGFGGQNSIRQHIGLGQAPIIDSIIIWWPSGYRQTLTQVNPNQFINITEENGAIITGRLYADANNNCQKEADEPYLAGQRIVIAPLGIQVYTDNTGTYKANLPLGQYTLTFPATDTWQTGCVGNINTVLTQVAQNLNLGDWAMTAVCQCTDIKINASSTAMRRGFGGILLVHVSNQGSQATGNTTVSVTIPESLQFLSATPPWSEQNQQGQDVQYQWYLPSIPANGEQLITIADSVTLALQVNDIVNIETEVAGDIFPDKTTNDNNYKMEERVVGAIDPNDLLAYPTGRGYRHWIDPQQEITYKIRFENIGNYPAWRIILRDTLPEGLDMSTLGDFQASHPSFDIQVQGRSIQVTFTNINLPATSQDSVASQGYFQFRVRPLTGITHGYKIVNSAHIQFDYNEYIATNQVFHTISGQRETGDIGRLDISPNPAISQIAVAIAPEGIIGENPAAIRQITVYSTAGQVVLSQTFEDNDWIELQLSTLVVGAYWVKAIDENGKIYTGKFIKTIH